jgi:hypothetical protein
MSKVSKDFLDFFLKVRPSKASATPYIDMEWLIPTQTLQVENVQLGSIIKTHKPLVPLAYKDHDIHFSSFSILLPLLTIKSFDKTTGQLILSMDDSSSTCYKFTTIQDMLVSAVSLHHKAWFPNKKGYVDLKAGFQPMIRGSEIHLYCPTQNEIMQSVPFFCDGEWSSAGLIKGRLEAGKRIRVAIRLQGISFLLHPNSDIWTGKYRIQHKILGVLLI